MSGIVGGQEYLEIVFGRQRGQGHAELIAKVQELEGLMPLY